MNGKSALPPLRRTTTVSSPSALISSIAAKRGLAASDLAVFCDGGYLPDAGQSLNADRGRRVGYDAPVHGVFDETTDIDRAKGFFIAEKAVGKVLIYPYSSLFTFPPDFS